MPGTVQGHAICNDPQRAVVIPVECRVPSDSARRTVLDRLIRALASVECGVALHADLQEIGVFSDEGDTGAEEESNRGEVDAAREGGSHSDPE